MEIKAEFLLPTKELRKDIPFFTNTLKMQMDMIYPADNPTVAVFSGHGIRIRIDKEAIIDPSFRKTDVAFLNNSSPIQTNKISLFDNHPEHKNWYFEGDNKINKLVYSYVMEANKLFFNYNIDYFEPLQFARYEKDYFYDWPARYAIVGFGIY